MGKAARRGDLKRSEAERRASSLDGLIVVVDVQHVYREGWHARDRGAVFTALDGTKWIESDLALHYAQAAIVNLRALGARVHTNDPLHGILVGPYARRQAAATVLRAQLYLACHVNAGGGGYALVEFMGATGSAPAAIAISEEIKSAFPHFISVARTLPLARPERGIVCIEGFTAGPALLVEPFFIDCPEHRPLMTAAGLEGVGAAIARGVVTWWRQRAVTG